MEYFKLIASYLDHCDVKSLHQVCKRMATRVIQEICSIVIHPDGNLSIPYFDNLHKTSVKYSSLEQITHVPVMCQSKYIKIAASSLRFLDNLNLRGFPFLEELVLEFKYCALPKESNQCQRLYSKVSMHNFLFPGGRGWQYIEDDPVTRVLW
jgi:hypothetical protein